MNQKYISVIIPCYNAVKYLPQCFLSLVQQSVGIDKLELIFVNDASTDSGQTWALLEEFERAYPESVIIIDRQMNQRQGGARNAGLCYASGEYIAFVDADDWVEVELFEKVYQKARETDADLVQFNHSFYSERTGVFGNPENMEDELLVLTTVEERKQFLTAEKITYGCWNKLYRRAIVEQAEARFAEYVIYEEPLFVYPLLYYGSRFAIMNERLYIYRQNTTGTMHREMQNEKTLLQHADVQLAVWKRMKQTEFFSVYYEEIKLYYLHTYFYETLYFAKLRNIEVTWSLYRKLEETVLKEVFDINCSIYETMIPLQMQLYRLTQDGMTEEKLSAYIESVPV